MRWHFGLIQANHVITYGCHQHTHTQLNNSYSYHNNAIYIAQSILLFPNVNKSQLPFIFYKRKEQNKTRTALRESAHTHTNTDTVDISCTRQNSYR